MSYLFIFSNRLFKNQYKKQQQYFKKAPQKVWDFFSPKKSETIAFVGKSIRLNNTG